MKIDLVRRCGLFAPVWALVAGLAGCAVAQPVAERLEPVPVGTVTTFNRVSSGSYGSGTGQVVWTYGEAVWQGQRVLDARNSAGGGTYHDPASFGILAMLNAAGQPVMTLSPPLVLDFPLTVGKTWTSRHTITLQPSGQQVPYEAKWSVQAHEQVTVPAGTFMAFKVVRVGSDQETETRWISLEPGLPLVKRILERLPEHRQGAGRQEGELVSYQIGKR